jgi:hypothetical protein
MVQLFGTTYRVLRVQAGHYEVVRIRDEVVVGSFSCGQTLNVTPLTVDAGLMRRLAAMAVYRGKTSWMGPCVVV